MTRHNIYTFCFLFLAAVGASAESALTVSRFDAGSIVTQLGFDIAVNRGSSLRREAIVINDPAAPVRLQAAAIETGYKDRRYSFRVVGEAMAITPITALEVNYVLLDVWGDEMTPLKSLTVQDLAGDFRLDGLGVWNATEGDVSRYAKSIIYIRRARTADGVVWNFNKSAIDEVLGSLDNVDETPVPTPLPDEDGQRPRLRRSGPGPLIPQ